MKARIKIDFEKWFISLLKKDTKGLYLESFGNKYYVYFEGVTIPAGQTHYISIRIIPTDKEQKSIGTIYHEGFYRFYCYASNSLELDYLTDTLSSLLDNKDIDIKNDFKIILDVLKVYQRDNVFDSKKYGNLHENINHIRFRHWSCT